MVDVGTAPGTTNTARILVNEAHPGTMIIVGAGTDPGPSRKIDVFEDVRVWGNIRVGEMHAVRLRFEQGVDGTITQGADDEVPRVVKLTGDARLHVIGGGPLGGPSRDVVLWDDVRVANDLVVVNDLTVSNDATVAGESIADGGLRVGDAANTLLTKVLTGATTVDPAAGGSPYGPVTINVTVTGAIQGDLAFATVTNTTLPDDVFVVVRGVTTNTVIVELVNLTGSTLDQGNITITALVVGV